jgi:hypothetical protein
MSHQHIMPVVHAARARSFDDTAWAAPTVAVCPPRTGAASAPARRFRG